MTEKGDAGDKNITPHETIDERLLNRVIFFTDAVFAIVLTLMILDLKPPPFDSPLGSRDQMLAMASHFFAMAMSFWVIGVFWIAHLSTTRKLRHFDWPTAVANLIFMFPICLIPFATAWWGRDLSAPFPWGMYCATMMVCSAANLALVMVVTRGRGRLMGGITPRERVYRVARAASPGVAFGVCLLFLTLRQTLLSEFAWLLIPAQIFAYERTLKPTAARP